MATLADMRDRIYQEMHQTRTVAVMNAIQSAVQYYKNTRFWCNEGEHKFALSTTTSQYVLSAILPQMLHLDSIVLTRNNQPSSIEQVPWSSIVAIDDGGVRGQPLFWSIHHGVLRFYPHPDATYTVEAAYLREVTLSASPSHSSIWTNELEPLIRARAKALVYADFMRDAEQALLESQVEAVYLRQFLERTVQQNNLGTVSRYL